MTTPEPAGTASGERRTGASVPEPFTGYQRGLFFFLSTASFFEGYDFTALSQILPNLRAEMGISQTAGGQLAALIGLGTILSYGMVRLADVLGRRRVLSITILGYASCTFLTGLASGPITFTLAQVLARVFLVAEWAVCVVFAAEEFPADRRGFVIGVIQAATTLGSIVCAMLVPVLLDAPWGWRTVYFVGVAPLLLLAYARRGLRETGRFQAVKQRRAGSGVFRLLRSPYRGRVLQVASIWLLTYLCTQSAVLFWKEFAVGERGFTDEQVGLAVSVAAIASLPFVFLVGKLLDILGRRRSAVLIYGVCAVFVVLAYQLDGFWPLTLCLVPAVFAAVGIPSLLNAYTTELFPTAVRADAFALSNNLLGRVGYVIGPSFVGLLAGWIGWGNAVSMTAGFVVAALVLILWRLPETRGRELEETATL